jgi:uncharacterized metal-binding protein
MLIPCCHFNRQGEIGLRACYALKAKYPRMFLIATPPTIGASPLLLASFGIEPDRHIAVNGCGLKCVDKLLDRECKEVPAKSVVLFDKPDLDQRSALAVTDEDVALAVARLEEALDLRH